MRRREVLAGLAGLSAVFGRPAAAAAQGARTIRILSIDGGGIRGAFAARVLSHLDDGLRAASGKGVAETFDLFAGTSTGSIIAAALAAADLQGTLYRTPAQITEAYLTRGAEIFRKRWRLDLKFGLTSPQYETDGLHALLADALKDVRMDELRRNLVIPFYNMNETNQANGPIVALGGPGFASQPAFAELRLRNVVQASCSAPTYFNPLYFDAARDNHDQPERDEEDAKAYAFRGVDGGVFANNPALIALALARAHLGDGPAVVVSVGCGQDKPPRTASTGSLGVYEWVRPGRGVPLWSIAQRGQTDTVELMVRQLIGRGVGAGYHRLQADFSQSAAMQGYFRSGKSSGLDNASKEHLKALVAAADEYAAGERGRMALEAALKQLA